MLKSVGSPGHGRPNCRVNPDSCWDAYIWVKDADALYEELQSRGVKITREIENTAYGCRDFVCYVECEMAVSFAMFATPGTSR